MISNFEIRTSLSVSDTETSDNQLVLRIVKTLPFIHQPDRVGLEASDVQQLIGYINTREKYDIFSRVLLLLFSGPKIFV